jgi:hypothetical protein
MIFRPVPIFEVVRLIDLPPPGEPGFCMLLAPSFEAGLSNELRDELDVQTGKSLGTLDVHDLTAADLVEQLPAKQDPVILTHGFEAWHDDQFASLDVNRSRLETGAFLIFTVDPQTAARFLNHAPNIRSFLGANIFAIGRDPSFMTPEEIEDRLNQLRNHYGLSDATVIERAANGDLPPEPHFVEWLLLLGRSELVR